MRLTPGMRNYIDSLSYQELWECWQSYRIGNPLFKGETGVYWESRMRSLQYQLEATEERKEVSKS